MKAKFEIDISPAALSNLEAHQVLAILALDNCHHLSKNLRLPLGIYNISVSRVAEKLAAFCGRLEMYFQTSNKLEELHEERKVRKELIAASVSGLAITHTRLKYVLARLGIRLAPPGLRLADRL